MGQRLQPAKAAVAAIGDATGMGELPEPGSYGGIVPRSEEGCGRMVNARGHRHLGLHGERDCFANQLFALGGRDGVWMSGLEASGPGQDPASRK